jgi:hypothetical protein
MWGNSPAKRSLALVRRAFEDCAESFRQCGTVRAFHVFLDVPAQVVADLSLAGVPCESAIEKGVLVTKGPSSVFGRGARGGPVLRIRGREHFVHGGFSKGEIVQIVIFLFLLVVVLVLAMYVGWWTMQEEEREWEHKDANTTSQIWPA